MKKNVLRILSILAVLIVVLFANVSFADESITFNFDLYANAEGEYQPKAEEGVVYEIKLEKDNEKGTISIYFDTFSQFNVTSNPKLITSLSIPDKDDGYTSIPFMYKGPKMNLSITKNKALNSESISLTDQNGNTVTKDKLTNGKNYNIIISNKDLREWASDENTDNEYLVFSSPDGVDFYLQYKTDGDVVSSFTKEADEKIANGAEVLITRLFLAIGDVFLGAIRGALGSDLSIDNLVFNRYEGTKISFFGGQTSVLNNVLIDVVNYWYKALSNFTFVLYIIILVYIGIMIVATSGTPKQDKAKAYFGDWIVGLFILMFLPYYGFPALFKINDALVEYVGRGSQTFQTYYNLEEKYGVNEIKGGDSYTILVEKIEGELNETKTQSAIEKFKIIFNIYTIRKSIGNSILGKLDLSENDLKVNRDYINSVLNSLISKYKTYRELGNNGEASYDKIVDEISSGKEDVRILSQVYYDLLYELKENKSRLQPALENALEYEITAEDLEQDLESLNKDIMGTMRSLAGNKLRIVYAIIWLMLIFQLVGLTILYYKRIFVIALLIAIFPLVMLTYCIDKMADGAAQTFSSWMKEFLSNIFIQTVHAIIYAVLIDMGLQIYEGGEENWIFLVGAMFLLLPAEAIMKEIFDLNGSTLSQVGGTFSKFVMGAGALVSLARAGKSEKDKSIKTANDNRMKRLQNSQNRADMKAKDREFRSTYKLDKSEYDGAKGKIDLVKDKLSGNVKYTANPGGKPNRFREGIYHGATAARKAYAKAAPKAGRVIRGVRNTTAITAGALYAASGGDVQSLAQGAAIARGLSGKTSDAKQKADLKTELKSAYERKK